MQKCIFNGTVVRGGELLQHHAVIIENDRIVSVLPTLALADFETGNGDMEYTDARGGYIMPGFIDLHSDYIEGVIQPRPGTVMDFSVGLREAEKMLCAEGVTLMYHSLSLMIPRVENETLGIRAQECVDQLVSLIETFHEGRHLIRHRFHARYEIDNLEGYEHLAKLIQSGKVHQLSFMDHTPGQGQYRDIAKYSAMFKNWKQLRTDDELNQYLEFCQTKPKASHEMLIALSELARERNIPIASHDVDSIEQVGFLKETYGVNISEFPVTLEVARAARGAGMLVVVGAPNILLGRSHSGNLSATEAIANDCADILCSDYYPAALLNAVFQLAKRGVRTLPQAVDMVTLNPAKAMRIDGDFGSVDVGKKADLLIVREHEEHPMIEKVFINGRCAMSFGYRIG